MVCAVRGVAGCCCRLVVGIRYDPSGYYVYSRVGLGDVCAACKACGGIPCCIPRRVIESPCRLLDHPSSVGIYCRGADKNGAGCCCRLYSFFLYFCFCFPPPIGRRTGRQAKQGRETRDIFVYLAQMDACMVHNCPRGRYVRVCVGCIRTYTKGYGNKSAVSESLARCCRAADVGLDVDMFS